jgi:hypothetical protein
VIFCVGDAINYLRKFAQWESTFKSVNNHLKDDGLFILEMETPRILKDNNSYGCKKMVTSIDRSNHFEILETNPMEKGRIVVFACRKK